MHDPAIPEQAGTQPAPRLDNGQWKTYILRTWKGRCPRCGEGTLFASRFRLARACDSCSHVYRREQGAMTGQMYLSAIVTEILAALLVLVIFFGTSWSPAVSIAVSVPIIVVFSLWFLPRAMGLWVAIELMTDIANREPWTRQ